MDRNIFLGEFDSKKSISTNSALNVELDGKRRLLPSNDASCIISSYDQYTEERDNCNKIRLTCQVNPICSNVLFNRVSEIVKDEGSSGVTFVNYGIYKNTGDTSDYDYVLKDVLYKTPKMSFWSGNSATYQEDDERVSMLAYDTPIVEASSAASDNFNSQACFKTPSIGGRKQSLHPTNAIRDMQLSRIDDEKNHFVYHCGLDILNNHLIRSKTFRPICPFANTFGAFNSKCDPENADTTQGARYGGFNTIADVMRDVDGMKVVEKIYFPINAGVDGNTKMFTRHVYEYDDICTFEEAVETRLVDKYNGWLGFVNKGKIKSYSNFSASTEMDIERPVMYMNSGDFVDMYPSRDLYSFVPKWNKFKKRIEKNWNYCVTYPSSSTTKGFDDIIERHDKINALKAVYFDENTRADNGTSQIVIYGITKHGLKVGEYVNVYKTYEVSGVTTTEKIMDNAKVASVADDYIFTVFGGDVKISDSWVELSDDDMANGYLLASGDTADDPTYILDSDSRKYFTNTRDTTKRYYIVNAREGYNGYVSLDDTTLNLSYKKVVGDVECEYYVRIFSKLPNFKFASGTTTEYDLYRTGSTMIQTYNKKKYEFENHLSRLAFAKNIYSDDVGEIVFTDDIDISNLKDNLGRPLSSIYLTIIKNNKGYKEWYGFLKNDVEWSTNWVREHSDDIEFSHCFGKITCGFYLSDESVYTHATSIKKMNHSNDLGRGYNCANINSDRTDELNAIYDSGITESFDDCEIWYDTDSNFYGDLCYYDAFNAVERVVQPIMHRFNTAQRECVKSKSTDYFCSFIYDDIKYDDYDTGNRYMIDSKLAEGCNNKKEGYYYIPHYEIPIKTFDMANTVLPDFLTIRSLVNMPDGVKVTVLENHYLSVGDKAMICDEVNNKYYYCLTTSSINDKVFICDIYDEDGNKSDNIPDLFSSSDIIDDYKLFKTDNLDIPSYANLIKDGSCRFIWRNIVNNGMNPNDKTVEEYPFTNGAFYVNKRIDLYVRRQDPLGKYLLYSDDDLGGKELEIEKEDNYVKEDEIIC